MTKHVHIEATGADGAREITATGWDGRILRMSRDGFLKWRKGGADKLPTACVFILLADDFSRATPQQRFLYVGQTADALPRAELPERDKPFWNVALVFTSASNWMGADHARVIEQAFIEWAREANRYDVANSLSASDSFSAPAPEPIVQAYLASVRMVLELAGIDVFQFNTEGLYTLACGPRIGRHDKARARVLSAPARTIEVYQDSRLSVNQLPETVKRVEDLVAQGAASFDSEAGIVTFIRPTRLIAHGPFDTMLGTFPKDWLNKNRVSIRDAFDAHGAGRQAVRAPREGAPQAEADAHASEAIDLPDHTAPASC